jgi:cysteine synthase B
VEAVAARSGLDRSSVLSAIGHTPLVRLRRFEPREGVELYAKLEARNPGGSIKDRAARAIVLEAERTGALGPGRVLLDASSGNTGIAYAMIAAARGHGVRLCVPANVTPERLRLLRTLGADVVLTDPMEGTDGAIREAQRIHASAPGSYCYANQYANPANWRAHYETTGPEILAETEGRLTHFVAGLGTSGTFMGAGRRFRETDAAIVLASVQPDSPWHGLEGLKHMATAIVPAIYDPTLADVALSVNTERALGHVRRLAREEGLYVGPSSGAALDGALQLADGLRRGVVVTVFPDGGDRYGSEAWWEDDRPPLVGVSRAAAEAIRVHAAETYPQECCGALIGGVDRSIASAMRLDNVTASDREHRFLVSPDAYRRAEREADATGRTLVGFYHSHPDHPAEPSAFDLAHAWPSLSYIIVSVHRGVVADVRSWRLRADRSAFDAEPLVPRS